MLHFAYDAKFASITDYLDAVEQTREHEQYQSLGAAQYSCENSTTFAGPPMETFIAQCRTMQGFEREITLISAMVQEIIAHLPYVQSRKRERSVGRTGTTLRLHAVNRGQLAQAWTRRRRIVPPGETINFAVLIPSAWNAMATENDILYTMACNVALVEMIEASGRTCDVWSISANSSAYGDAHGHRQLVHVHQAGTLWSVHSCVCLTSLAWYRRLGFRLMEAQQDHLRLVSSYGTRIPGFWPQCHTQTCTDLGYAPHGTVAGASQSDTIDSLPSALAWLHKAIAELHLEE